MDYKKELKTLFTKGQNLYLQSVSVDCIIFGFHENELRVLLLKPKYLDDWALPGGFIKQQEDLHDAAKRILFERTGLQDIYLQQFETFGDASRTSKPSHQQLLSATGLEITKSWIFERFITVGYYALVDFSKVQPIPGFFSEKCEWFSLQNLPSLMLDHRNIFQNALDYLRLQLNYHPVGYNLLPAQFTMPQLQKLYEAILGRNLDRRNFQRKIFATGILKKLEKKQTGLAHKSPYLFKFEIKKYQKALSSGLGFDL